MLRRLTRNLRWIDIFVLLLWNNFSNVASLSLWGTMWLLWTYLNLMTAICNRCMLILCWWALMLIDRDIISFELFVFIIFINWLFFIMLIFSPVRDCLLSFFFSILSCRLLVSLWRSDCWYLTLVYCRALRGQTFSVFLNQSMWLIDVFWRNIFIISIVLSQIRTNSHRFIVRLPCFLTCCVFLAWLLLVLTYLLSTSCWW